MLIYRTILRCLSNHHALVLAGCIATNAGAVELSEIEALIAQVEADQFSISAVVTDELAVVQDSKILEEKLHESNRRLSLARASTLAEFCDLDPHAIVEQHAGGKSWQQIAHDLSVHPSVIGIEIVDPRPPTLAPVSRTQ